MSGAQAVGAITIFVISMALLILAISALAPVFSLVLTFWQKFALAYIIGVLAPSKTVAASK